MDNGTESYRRFLSGDNSALAEIIEEYKDGLILFINGYVKNLHTAEELTEETFFRLVVKRPGFSGNSSFKTWLYAVGRNLALNFLKHRAREAPLTDEATKVFSEQNDAFERQYLLAEQKLTVQKALSALPAQYAEVLHLVFFEGFKNADASKIMHKSTRQIENLVYRAKLALKEELEKEGFTYENI